MLASNDLGGTGTINLQHLAQNRRTRKFATFAHDGVESVDYDVSKLNETLKTTDVLLFTGEKDAFSQPADVAMLKKLFPEGNVEELFIKDYGHNDYMWADNIDETVNPKMFEFIEKHA